MKNDNLKFKIFSCIFVFVFAWFSVAKAESPHLSVSPHTFELTVNRGQIVKDKIRILNQSNFPIPMLVKITDFTAQEETGQMLINKPEDNSSFAARQWIKIEKPNFILDPAETEIVNFSAEIPKNAEPGGHYATVLFEPQLPSNYFKEGEPKVIPVIGVIFLFSVEVEGAARSSEPITVAEFNIPEKFHVKKLEKTFTGITGLFSEAKAKEKEMFSIVETSYLPFTLRLKNNDIYHSKPFGKLEIFSIGGKSLGETEITKNTILPGKTREIPVNFKPQILSGIKKYLPVPLYDFLSRNLVWGKYQARLSLAAESPKELSLGGAGDYKIEKNIEFWVFPWKTGIVLIFVLVILILTRKRIGLAMKVLFNSKFKNQNGK